MNAEQSLTHSTKRATSYRARWVFPVDQPPIAGGVVTIADGRIVSVGTQGGGETWIDLGNVAVLPGLINAHTHLEFSLFDPPLGTRGQSFPAWLKQVVAWRREQPEVPGRNELALQQGLQESQAAGVAVLGEIATPLFADIWNREFVESSHVRFLELLSLNPERVAPLAELADEYTQHQFGTGRGLSPHSPYTVHPDLLVRAVQLSAERQFPIAMHLAESREELQLLASHTGALVELLQSLEAWYPQSLSLGLRPLDYLQTLAKAHRALIAHGNYLQRDEIEFVSQQRERMSIVYCPRTHAYFDHAPYPLAEMLRAGVRVAVGTDSKGSNPDLSVWNELRFIHEQHPQIAPEEVLKMGTISGAEALGVQRAFGSISPGKTAALAVIDLPDDNASPYDSLFACSKACRPLAE